MHKQKIMAQLTSEFWDFVRKNINEDTSRLRLKYHGATNAIDYELAITQIECRKRFGKKISDTLNKFDEFLFPDTLSGEQCTSDLLAEFHSTLINDKDIVYDLTAGLGIDCLHLSLKAQKIVAIERKQELVDALTHNASGLNCNNISMINGDSCNLIKDEQIAGDVAFIDPARRSAEGGRVYALSQCEPNVVELQDQISRHFKRLVIKMSPMLDINQTLKEVSNVTDIYAIGTKTECKELVAKVTFNDEECECTVHAVTINSTGAISEYSFTIDEEASAAMPHCAAANEGDFLYELYPAVMKAAPLKLLAAKYGLNKFHNNTHVYFSKELMEDVPADIWVIEKIIEWKSKNIKQIKSLYPKIDIATRNFGMSADALRAKLGVKQGGDHRLLGVTDCMGDKKMLILRKLSN